MWFIPACNIGSESAFRQRGPARMAAKKTSSAETIHPRIRTLLPCKWQRRLRTSQRRFRRRPGVVAASFVSSARYDAETVQQTTQTTPMKKILILTLAITSTALLSASAGDAKEIYEKACAKCHGKDGKGDTKMGKKSGAKDYTNPKVQEEMKDDKAFKVIKEGLKDKDDKVLMKPAEDISDADIKALIAHMRKFKK
jgi:cytochrome c553